MADHSRWDDIKNKRPAPSTERRVGVEHGLALGQLIYDLRTEEGAYAANNSLSPGRESDERHGPMVAAVPDDGPLVHLPDEVTLTRDEIGAVLFALDLVDGPDIDEPDRATVRRAIRLLTSKLWPELGDLLDDDGEG